VKGAFTGTVRDKDSRFQLRGIDPKRDTCPKYHEKKFFVKILLEDKLVSPKKRTNPKGGFG
jgi:hypothetical protein